MRMAQWELANLIAGEASNTDNEEISRVLTSLADSIRNYGD